ncbi:MAG: hypothetical protein ACRDSR_18180 [Pseudonocardiaceae bacterium]
MCPIEPGSDDGYPTIPPLSPDPRVHGLEPLDEEPVSVHPPYVLEPGYRQDRTERYHALLTAIGDGIELGSYDGQVLGWLSEETTCIVAAVCSLLHRIRAAALYEGAALREGNQNP